MASIDRSPREVGVDLLLLASVPVFLAVIHFLVPPGIEEQFVLRPGAATALTLFSAAFFHLGLDHLLGNLAAFVIGAGYAYLLCLLIGERRWFWVATASLVLGLPVLVNWTSIHMMNAVIGGWVAPMRGFSGVSAGFGGLAYVALLIFINDRTDPRTATFVGLSVLLLLLWEILLIYADGFPYVATAAVLVGVGLAIVGIGLRWWQHGRPSTWEGWRSVAGTGLVVLWMVVVLGVLVVGMFPPDLIVGGRFTNIFAHSAGFVFGVVIAGWGYRYWRRRPTLAELWRRTAKG